MRYKSIATWTKIDSSEDEHRNKEQAEGVCEMLLKYYGKGKRPCEIRGNCLSAIAVPIINVSTINKEPYGDTSKCICEEYNFKKYCPACGH
jgi:hypothetical protein